MSGSGRAMLAAFEGWNDAADAASGAIEHLEREWSSRPFAAIDPEDYYDYQVNRPTVRLVDGMTRRIEWPTRTARDQPSASMATAMSPATASSA